MEKLRTLINEVERDALKFTDTSRDFSGELSGMSGLKFRILVSEITAKMPDGLAYLELGIYQGLTPLSVAKRNPKTRVVGVDDFSQFDPHQTNLKKIRAQVEQHEIGNFEFFDSDFEKFLREDPAGLKGSVGVYFFDASHDYRSQILALMHAPAWLAEGGVIVVDDCNYPHVRQATVDFLHSHPEYKLLCEFYTGRHPNWRAVSPPTSRSQRILKRIKRAAKISNQDSAPPFDDQHMRYCQDTWWNGVNIIVHDPHDTLVPIVPHVPADLRGKFVKQHGFAGCNAEGCMNKVAAFR